MKVLLAWEQFQLFVNNLKGGKISGIPMLCELSNYKTKGSILPKNAVYVYNGYPTHSVKGYSDDEDNNRTFYIAFCYEHESESDFGPNNHCVIVYTESDGSYVYSETFNTDEAYSSLENDIKSAFGIS